MTKAELEDEVKNLKLENVRLQVRIDELEAGNGDMPLAPTNTLSQEDIGYVEPLLLGACIGALRNPISGVAYSESEFQAYAPEFIDQAVRMHNMALERLAASKGLSLENTGNGNATVSGVV